MKECIFCKIARKEIAASIIYEDEKYMAFLDKYPQSRGHLQCIPKMHYRWVYEVPDMGELFATVGYIVRAIIPILNADHVTIATFGHAVAHAHVWIVPQYGKDKAVAEYKKLKRLSDQEELAYRLREGIKKL